MTLTGPGRLRPRPRRLGPAWPCLLAALLTTVASGCHRAPPSGPVVAMSLAVFETTPEGRSVPSEATAGFLAFDGDRWRHGTLRDSQSNVFHKLLPYCPRPGECGLLTLGGTAASLKLWRGETVPEVLWVADFGGRFSRMRDAEVADVLREGAPQIVVATHDQGVVAVVRPTPGGYEVREIDRQPETFVHEIEVGDLDADGTPEVYATPSQPNVLDGTPQHGSVVRYVPARGEGRTVVADLGDRHAKEILVTDLDGDGRDELYVAVEAVSGGSVEIRRYLAGTPVDAGDVVATLPDALCRCLSAGDVDGDGRREIVATPRKAGIWLLRPHDEGPWEREIVASDSSGFEHAALLADLDADGADELYVASDDQREVRRYVWRQEAAQPEVIYRHPEETSGFTWSLTVVDAALVPVAAWR